MASSREPARCVGRSHRSVQSAGHERRCNRPSSRGRATNSDEGRDLPDHSLGRICRKIAADEARHEVFYTKVVAELFERDPERTLLAHPAMLRRLIAMSGSRMTDGRDPNLFGRYAAVARRTGVYTALDSASIIRHLNDAWGLEGRSFTDKAARAQDYLCRQPVPYESLAAEIECGIAEQPPARFSWLYDRTP